MIPNNVPAVAVYRHPEDPEGRTFNVRVAAWDDEGRALVANSNGELVPVSAAVGFLRLDSWDGDIKTASVLPRVHRSQLDAIVAAEDGTPAPSTPASPAPPAGTALAVGLALQDQQRAAARDHTRDELVDLLRMEHHLDVVSRDAYRLGRALTLPEEELPLDLSELAVRSNTARKRLPAALDELRRTGWAERLDIDAPRLAHLLDEIRLQEARQERRAARYGAQDVLDLDA